MEQRPFSSGEITICTSYHSPETKAELELNHDFTRRMNPESRITWLVGEAMEGSVRERISREQFTVFAAPTKDEVPHVTGWRSIQHAGALNLLLKHVQTRFFVVMHPDFYIVRPHWIQDVITHMDASGLAFVGSPVYPRYFDKWRYFPCTQCIVADREKIPVEDIDFMPGDMKMLERGYAMRDRRGFWKIGEAAKLLYSRLIRMRSLIGTSRDSGYRLVEKFSRRPDILCECFQPFFRPWRDRDAVDNKLWVLNAMIEFFLPERLCFVPKRKASYSVKGFRDCGYPDAARHGFEEYFWAGRPFAFHQRGTRAGYSRGSGHKDTFAAHFDQIRQLLDQCSARAISTER